MYILLQVPFFFQQLFINFFLNSKEDLTRVICNVGNLDFFFNFFRNDLVGEANWHG